MELTLFGFGILAMLAGWRYAWRPTALDCARDRLFDLRESVREDFIARGWGLAHPMYKTLRDLINGHLRYTERVHFFGLIAFHVKLASRPELRATLKTNVERRLSCDDAEVAKYGASVREKAALIMLAYVIETSAIALVLVMIGMAILAVRKLGKLSSLGVPTTRKLFRTAILSSALMASLQPANASQDEVQAFMEEHALSIA